MRRGSILAPWAALVVTATSVFAADEPASAPVTATAAPGLAVATPAVAVPQPFTYQKGGSNVTLMLYLVLLLVLIGGGAWLVRNGFTLFQPKLKGARKLQISEMRMLGNRQFLVVAEYEDRKMLLGVCPGRIDYLATLAAREQEFADLGPEARDE